MESKHGDIYTAHGDDYNWDSAPGTWTPGVDFRGPTCASCHMSGAGTVLTSHDVTERLSWEIQAPLTVRPQNFKPLPAKTDWKVERDKMKAVCMQCHGKNWVDNHYVKLDRVVQEYNDVYFKPAKAMLQKLYAKGLLDKSKFFDERLEIDYYELWHHEGRRARMGAAMMAPDYAWWHGLYEVSKHFYTEFIPELEELGIRVSGLDQAFEPLHFQGVEGVQGAFRDDLGRDIHKPGLDQALLSHGTGHRFTVRTNADLGDPVGGRMYSHALRNMDEEEPHPKIFQEEFLHLHEDLRIGGIVDAGADLVDVVGTTSQDRSLASSYVIPDAQDQGPALDPYRA